MYPGCSWGVKLGQSMDLWFPKDLGTSRSLECIHSLMFFCVWIPGILIQLTSVNTVRTGWRRVWMVSCPSLPAITSRLPRLRSSVTLRWSSGSSRLEQGEEGSPKAAPAIGIKEGTTCTINQCSTLASGHDRCNLFIIIKLIKSFFSVCSAFVYFVTQKFDYLLSTCSCGTMSEYFRLI